MTHYICTGMGTGSVNVVNGVRAPTKNSVKGILIAAIFRRGPGDPGSGSDDEGGIEGTGVQGIGIEGTGFIGASIPPVRVIVGRELLGLNTR